MSGILAAAFPSVVLWSSLNLKDADVALLVLAGRSIAIQPWEGRRLKYSAAMGLTLLILLSLREFAAGTLAISVIVALVARSGLARRVSARAHPWLTVGGPIAGLGLLALAAGVLSPRPGALMFQLTGLGRLARLRWGLALGANSATNPDPGLGTLAGALKFLPTGLIDFLLRPFPWESGSALAVLTRPETVAYYMLLIPAAAGILLALRRTPARALPLVTFLAISTEGYALVLANLGTIYRERALLLLILFVFIGVAVERLRRSSPARHQLGLSLGHRVAERHRVR